MMTRLGLRLTLGSGREALLRVIVTATAVALGVGLLLIALAGVNGLHAQAVRGAWLDTSTQTAPSSSASAPLWWQYSTDQFGSQLIDRVEVAATGSTSPVPPGLSRLPGPGQFDASPALARLLAATPRDQLADRFPGRQVATIGAAALPSPNSLIIVIGYRASQLSGSAGAIEVRGIQRTLAGCLNCRSGIGSGPVLQWILWGAAVALLLPVLILIATASRLSAARREERFAAMRLVGATPHQISVIAAVEATVAALAGVAVGFALFFACRPLLYRVPFTGVPLAQGDLSLSQLDVVLVVLGVPIAAVASARLALRRVRTTPFGVARRARSAPPNVVRVVPLLAGVAVLAYFDAAGKPGSNAGQVLELLGGFVLLVVGLVVAGPWLTTAGARLMASRADHPAALIAGRRLLDNPRAAFRFVTGLVLALFITSAVIGALSSIDAASASTGGSAGRATLADLFCSYTSSQCAAGVLVRAVPATTLAELNAIPGVRAVTVVHDTPAGGSSGSGVVACHQLAATLAIGRCEPGATVATVGWFLQKILGNHSTSTATVWPSANVSTTQLDRLPVNAIVVATDGSFGAIERARTSLEAAFPEQGTAVVVEAVQPEVLRLLAMIQDMTDVIVVASLLIAACSLAVNVAAGLGERRRPFSLLRLTGVATGVLHRVVALEAALPLLLVAALSIAIGLVSSALYLSSQVGIAFRIPGLGYWGILAGGLAASLAIIAATFPLLDRMTGPEVARND